MKKLVIGLVVIIAILLVVVITSYNGIVSKHENVENAKSDLEVMLQRRADLIPNLVNSVKGYLVQESEIVEKVTEARTKLVNANNLEDKSKANDELSNSLNALMLVVENYPDLKSSENFIQLSDELAGTENRIATARRDYNNAVKVYNTAIIKFPSNIMANMFGFEKTNYFEADDKSAEVPSVNFE